MIFSIDGKTPNIHPTAFVAPSAVLIGDVTLEENSSVWFGAVLRADSGKIVIGEGTNVQDGAILHEETVLGKFCVLAHSVLVHKAVLGNRVLIGHGALVYRRRERRRRRHRGRGRGHQRTGGGPPQHGLGGRPCQTGAHNR